MKLTEQRKNWIIKKIKEYCKLLKKKPPRVIFSIEEANKWMKKCKSADNEFRSAKVDNETFGLCWFDRPAIFINIRKHQFKESLLHTIRHEIVHYARPSYSHGLKFEICIERLRLGHVKNGKFCSGEEVNKKSRIIHL